MAPKKKSLHSVAAENNVLGAATTEILARRDYARDFR
jgi:hypothetical protein